MFQKVDCLRIHVPDVDEALAFYRDRLGLELAWRRGPSDAGLKMRGSDTEVVVVREELGAPEVDILVESADGAARDFGRLGGRVVVPPFDVAIGRCAVVADPWGNRFVVLDMSKGPLKTDADRNVLQDG